ncbi:ribonuclease 3-like protein 1 isoform X2 [Phragmites australis]|uniref:ribonuclease 3-like protein 1 isoform X2 n=1 Tax=Phragmites australis TaxID=29695 RepID=UPI002D76BFE2|nr:ribonuclease 3-like protein 1 isoform X2 [Phragmites australis]
MQPRSFEADREEAAARVERVLRYRFRDRLLLEEALTHMSFTDGGRGPSYQRLAFLGDSAIYLLFSKYFYREYRDLGPGELTDLRKDYITNKKLARIAVEHNLYPLLRHKCPGFDREVSLFTDSVQKETEGKAPKVLADIVEAIAGAVYVDSRFDLEKLRKVASRLFKEEALHLAGGEKEQITKAARGNGSEELGEFEQKPNEQCSKKHYWPKRIFTGILAAFFISCTLAAIDTSSDHAIVEISFFVGFAWFCLKILLWVIQLRGIAMPPQINGPQQHGVFWKVAQFMEYGQVKGMKSAQPCLRSGELLQLMELVSGGICFKITFFRLNGVKKAQCLESKMASVARIF